MDRDENLDFHVEEPEIPGSSPLMSASHGSLLQSPADFDLGLDNLSALTQHHQIAPHSSNDMLQPSDQIQANSGYHPSAASFQAPYDPSMQHDFYDSPVADWASSDYRGSPQASPRPEQIQADNSHREQFSQSLDILGHDSVVYHNNQGISQRSERRVNGSFDILDCLSDELLGDSLHPMNMHSSMMYSHAPNLTASSEPYGKDGLAGNSFIGFGGNGSEDNDPGHYGIENIDFDDFDFGANHFGGNCTSADLDSDQNFSDMSPNGIYPNPINHLSTAVYEQNNPSDISDPDQFSSSAPGLYLQKLPSLAQHTGNRCFGEGPLPVPPSRATLSNAEYNKEHHRNGSTPAQASERTQFRILERDLKIIRKGYQIKYSELTEINTVK